MRTTTSIPNRGKRGVMGGRTTGLLKNKEDRATKQVRDLREKEYEKISTVVRQRTKEVDEKLADMMQSMKQKEELMKSRGSRGSTRTVGNSKLGATSSRYHKGGSIENDSLYNIGSVTATGLTIDGKGLGKYSMDPHNLLSQTQRQNESLEATSRKLEKIKYQREQEMTHEERDHLITFLAKLKITSEDRNITMADLKTSFLPPDLTMEGENCIPLDEFTIVLQSELGLPITKPEQMLLMEEYGYSNGMIDVKAVLSDAGLWDEDGAYDRSPSPQKHSIALQEVGSPEKKEGLDSLEFSPLASPNLSKYETLMKSPDRGTSRQQAAFEDRKGILEQTEHTLFDIHELHNLVEAAVNPKDHDRDDMNDINTAASRRVEDMLSGSLKYQDENPSDRQRLAHEQTIDHHQELFDNLLSTDTISSKTKPPKSISPTPPITAHDKKTENPSENLSSELLQNEQIKRIITENQKLKEEMKAFDSNFFEELEDMKYRYTKMVEMVGEDPFVDDSISRTLNTRRDTRSISPNARVGNLPLSRLSWSARNSMRAIDRASYDSPIVQGRRGVDYTRDHSRSISPSYRSGDSLLRGNQRDLSSSAINSAGQGTTGSSLLLPSKSGHIMDGGIHGIGEGKYAAITDPLGGTFSNLCERRLVFELSSHPRPAEVTSLLIHKIMDVAAKNRATQKEIPPDTPLYISVKQLQSILQQVGLQLTTPEIDMLCTGFASDGKGSIDAKEFCDMIRTLVYNLVGSHYQEGNSRGGISNSQAFRGSLGSDRGRWSGSLSQRYGNDPSSSSNTDLLDKDYQQLLQEVCQSIITYDRKAVLGRSLNLLQTLLQPFLEIDQQSSGMVIFAEFILMLKEMGVLLSRDEYQRLAQPFHLPQPLVESHRPSAHLNHLDQFRTNVLSGSLQGRKKTNDFFDDFLSSHRLKDSVQRNLSDPSQPIPLHDESLIAYQEFVQELVKCLQGYLEKKGGIPTLTETKRLPWIITEFELIDLLLTQLEEMSASHRRKTLITLQYALENADLSQTGELDGFAILSALLNAGFRLQRYHRVQLLKAAEAFGGQLEYRRLVLALLQTAVNWSQTERTIIFKVLKSMGNTMQDRRLWLAKMKKELMERVAHTQTSRKANYLSATTSGNSNHTTTTASVKRYPTTYLAPSDQDLFSLPIPPTIFLHVLRDLNVQLTPEEEAVLLDCLDTERIIKLQIKQLQRLSHRHQYLLQREETVSRDRGGSSGHIGNQQRIHSLLWNNEEDTTHSMNNNFQHAGLPMIDYYSFLHFVSRHCGSWIDSRPDLFTFLSKLLANVYHPEVMIEELAQLFLSFDEKSNGLISLRSFIICCHRCRLFANVDEAILYDLSETLVVDGVGEIPYQDFLLQLKGIHIKITQEQQEVLNRSQTLARGGRVVEPVTIVRQFIEQATDSEWHTLLPLRNYLLQVIDLETMLLTIPDFQKLLREFSIVYQPQEFEHLLVEISINYTLQTPYEQADVALTRGAMSRLGISPPVSKVFPDSEGNTPTTTTIKMVDVTKLLSKLMKARLPWYERNLSLVKKLLASFMKAAKESSSLSSASTTAGGGEIDHANNINTLEMMNMKIIQRIIARINAFSFEDLCDLSSPEAKRIQQSSSDISQVLQTNSTITMNTSYQQTRLIEWNIFEYILKSMGILLSRTEIQFLCDVCDPYPECHRINPYILMDLMQVFRHPPQGQNKTVSIDGEEQRVSSVGSGNAIAAEGELTEAAKYALNHLQTLIWRAKDSSFTPIHYSGSDQRGKRSTKSQKQHQHAFHSKYLHDEDYTATATSRVSTTSNSRTTPPSSIQRPSEQWQLDIQSIFKGFDYLQNGFIAVSDLLLIFKLINVTISMDLLRDIPFINFNTELVNYPKLLQYIFDISHLSKTQKFHLTMNSTNRSGENSYGDDDAEDLEDEIFGGYTYDSYGKKIKKKSTLTSSGRKNLKGTTASSRSGDGDITVPHAIQLLLNRIRSNISIFILNNHTMQEAWMELLKVFTQFDKQERNYITSRDFLLAISVLLTSTSVFQQDLPHHQTQGRYLMNANIHEKAEDLLFTKLEWEEILLYFRYDKEDEDGEEEGLRRNYPQQILEDLKINYLYFCEMVLNIKEIEKKLKDYQRYLHQKSLSSVSSSLSSSTTRRRGTGRMALDEEMDDFFHDILKDQSSSRLSGKTPMMKAHTQQLKEQERRLGLDRSSTLSKSQRTTRSVSPTVRKQSLSPSKQRLAPEYDPIAQQFQKSNEKYQSLFSNRQYGDHSRVEEPTSSQHTRRVYPAHNTTYLREDNVFREVGGTARGTLSPGRSLRRPSSASGLAGNAMTVSRKEINDRKKELAKGHTSSSGDLYQSSHRNRHNSTTGGKTVRFNWTADV